MTLYSHTITQYDVILNETIVADVSILPDSRPRQDMGKGPDSRPSSNILALTQP